MSVTQTLFCKALSICALSTMGVASFGTMASAQQTSLSIGSDMFSQQATDAITQGFRQEWDQLFFEEGIQQFEEEIRLLQTGENAEAILNIDPVFDDWQSLEGSTDTDL